jgi:hypothetical protein
MRYFLVLLLLAAIINTGCEKNDCNKVTITQIGTTCQFWGIKQGSEVYTADTIPPQFRQEGLEVCADYTLAEDLRTCGCCGGLWAKIIWMNKPE